MDPDNTTTPMPTTATSTPKTTDSEWVRRLLFFILFFLIVLSYSNLILATIFATLVNLLSINIFDTISKTIFGFCEKVLKILGGILARGHKRHHTVFDSWFKRL